MQTQQTQVRPTLHLDQIQVVTLGDSLAYGAGDEGGGGSGGIAGRLRPELASHGFRTVEVTNLGMNGARTADLLAKLEQQRVRDTVTRADVIVLSIGANDLFRTQADREATLRAPFVAAQRILDRIVGIVGQIHQLNPDAQIMILGGYNPAPGHPFAAMVNQYLEIWDAKLIATFEEDPRISIITLADIVHQDRLSRYDSFHPGGEAYQLTAERIAEMLAAQARETPA